MSDKPLHIDEKFTDQAWEGMRHMLDQEMPVPPGKRRPFLVFWWLGLLAVGLLVGAGYMLFGKKAAAPVAPNQPIAGSSMSQFPQQIEASTMPNNEPIASEKMPADITPTQAKGTPRIQPSAIGNKLNKNNSSIGKALSGAERAMKNNNAETLLNSGLQSVESAVSNDSSNTQGMPVLYEPVANSGINPLPNFLIPAFSSPLNSDLKVPAFSTKKIGWDWAIQANAIAVPNLSGGGFSVGVAADKYFVADKLSFGVGIGYTYLRQPIIANTFDNSVSENANDNIIYENAELTSFDATGVALTTTLKRNLNLHYLTVPIQINYCFAKQFSANVGLNTGILLSSPSDYTQDGILNNRIWQKQRDSKTGTTSKVSILDAAVTVGFGFRCSKRTSLHLEYLHGLRDVLPENNAGDYNRVIKVGVQYKLRSRR